MRWADRAVSKTGAQLRLRVSQVPDARPLFRTRSPARWHSSPPSTHQLFPWTSSAEVRVLPILTYKPRLGTPATRTRPLLAPPAPIGSLSQSALLSLFPR